MKILFLLLLHNTLSTFTVLLDEESEQLSPWQISGLPTTYVLDPEGRVVFQALGDREWDNDKLLDKVRALKTKSTSPEKAKIKESKIPDKIN